jgi:hypothetical protein
VQIRRAFDLFNGSEVSAADLRVLTLVIDIAQLARLAGIQKQTARTDELQRVPFGGIVTGGDRDAALRVPVSHLELNCRHGADADVENAIAGGEDAGDDGVLHHLAGRSRIAADNDRAGTGVRPERLREARQQSRRERLAHYAPHAGDADLECRYRSHCSLVQVRAGASHPS